MGIDIKETGKTKSDRYIEYALNESNPVSSWIRKVVAMHVADMAQIDDPDFPFYFDEAEAERVIRVIQKFKLSKGNSGFFTLLDWQAFTLWCAYGWKKKENKHRRYKRVFIKVARKNGKTELLCAIGIYGQFFDRYAKDPEIYWFATKQDQALKGFERQQEMTRNLISHSALFATKARVMSWRIVGRSDMSFTRYLGQDSRGEDGAIPFYALCDEWHAHPNNKMMNVMESGMVGQVSPMTWAITTAGYNLDGPCYQFEKTVKQGLDGIIDLGGVFPMIFDLDEGDDWQDEAVWPKPNPSLNQSKGAVTMDGLREEFKAIATDGVSKRIDFQTKNLNLWLKAHSEWIPMDVWRENAGPETPEQMYESLKGRLCFGGLDLAMVSDLSVLSLCFPPEKEDEPVKFLFFAFCAEDTAMRRYELDAVPYLDWAEKGYLILTPGNVTDFNFIKAKILEVCEAFNIHSIGFDPYAATHIVTDLMDEGIVMEKYAQNQANMSPMIKLIERAAIKNELAHGNNPVFLWCCSNVQIQNKPNDNVMLGKANDSQKIDAVTAAVIAYGQWQEHLDVSNDDILFAVL